MKNTFHKNERLKSKKQINQLFLKGTSFSKTPIKLIAEVIGNSSESSPNAQAMFVAPKKKFKHAHDRNLLKRRMKEAYRLNKNQFYEKLNAKGIILRCAFIYTYNQALTYAEIEAAVVVLLEQCVNKFKSNASNQIND